MQKRINEVTFGEGRVVLFILAAVDVTSPPLVDERITDARGWSRIVIRSVVEQSDPIRDDRLRSHLPTRVNFPAAERHRACMTAASASDKK